MNPKSPTMRLSSGVTLLELLVVMMILSLILTAAVKTWDVTLERGRFETTKKKLDQLATAIVGDPNAIVAGQRVDFGYVGDVGLLPSKLGDLVKDPLGLPDSINPWRGPYMRATFSESPEGYRVDGWGDTIVYSRDSLFVRSYGGYGPLERSRHITREFGYTYDALMKNTVDGQVMDVRGVPPPDTLMNGVDIRVEMYGPRNGILTWVPAVYGTNGQFRFYPVPQGNRYLLRAVYIHDIPPPVDSVVSQRYVTVYPKVGARGLQVRLDVDWSQE